MLSTSYLSPILTKLEFSGQTVKESSNMKFHEDPPSGNRVILCKRTDRRKDMMKRTIVFCNSMKAPKKRCYSKATIPRPSITSNNGSEWLCTDRKLDAVDVTEYDVSCSCAEIRLSHISAIGNRL